MTRRAHLRASDADRDDTVGRLHRAATEGRIAAEELEHRVARALKATTYGDLDATVSDLPRPHSRRPLGRTVASSAVSTVRAHPMLLLVAIPAVAVTVTVLLAVMVVWAVAMLAVLALSSARRLEQRPGGARLAGRPRPR